MYELARRIADGAPTPYDAITRIERYLRGAYEYRQNVPEHNHPLPAFLSEDRAGYCQQFSGAMALMLRMLGIPSRVAAGFSAGGRVPDGDSYLVQDTDAHNWVEAFFPGIGWVIFEPTPAAAPADTQLNDAAVGVSDPSLPTQQSPIEVPDPRDPDGPQPNPPAGGTAAAGGSGGSTALTISGTVAAALALVAALIYGGRRARTRRLDPDELAETEMRELERALARLGHGLPAGATLLRAEKRLGDLAGPRAAGYVAALRERRYRRLDRPPPGMPERRSLRFALFRIRTTARGGIGGIRWALRVLRAIPPGGPVNRREGRADRRISAWVLRSRPPSIGEASAPGSAR
jgi:hypothetical protein